ncbi:hypothetical protein FB45DRAFT_1082359 [Roridomyces roridus]|uniref:MYND-type domain-containing protein n=1 Tax=Roridomyces roridus TaxID=1738132 RepID=A0AAD7BQ95_9AGAR|nr:hypothetical protein FB45DRAFT_1082359 [Roridomyces roridus]
MQPSAHATQRRTDAHDRVLSVVDGDADFFVRLVFRRLRKVCKRFDDSSATVTPLALYIQLLQSLCLPDEHPLRLAFFNAGGIACVTRAFVAGSRIIRSSPVDQQVLLLLTCVSFFVKHLEGDGCLGVVRAMKMGFLQALLNCSPTFPQMPKEFVDAAMAIVRHLLPPYAVYRSFVDAVTPFLKEREQEKVTALPAIGTALTPFWSELAERVHALGDTDDEVTKCDNIECQRLDTERTFKMCGGCQVVYYCSRECQDRPLGRRDRIDQSRIQTLAQKMVHLNSATFHAIAERDFPDTPRKELVPCVDLSRVPEVFSVRTFDEAIGERFRPTADWHSSHGIASIVCMRKNGSEVREMWLRAANEDFWGV